MDDESWAMTARPDNATLVAELRSHSPRCLGCGGDGKALVAKTSTELEKCSLCQGSWLSVEYRAADALGALTQAPDTGEMK